MSTSGLGATRPGLKKYGCTLLVLKIIVIAIIIIVIITIIIVFMLSSLN